MKKRFVKTGGPGVVDKVDIASSRSFQSLTKIYTYFRTEGAFSILPLAFPWWISEFLIRQQQQRDAFVLSLSDSWALASFRAGNLRVGYPQGVPKEAN